MRLNRQLSINGENYQISEARVVLDLYAPGRARFAVVNEDKTPANRQLIRFDLGYSHQPAMHRWFTGYVEELTPVSGGRSRLFCRQLAAGLAAPLPMNLRHVTLREVLDEIRKLTGLSFSVPAAAYSDRKIPNFYNLGTGYQAMTLIERVFQIPDFIWQQQGHGVIYVGSWADSRWADIDSLTVSESLFDGHSEQSSARLPAIPQLRPGMRINGKRLTRIEFEGSHMVVSWKR